MRRVFLLQLYFLATLLVAAGVTAALVRLLRTDRCPADHFFSRVSVDAVAMMATPLMIALAGSGAILANALPAWIAALGNGRRVTLVGVLVAWAAWPFGVWAGLGNELCLSLRSIEMRDNALTQVRRYQWSDVSRVQTVCALRGGRHRHTMAAAHFFLSNGDSFWLDVSEYRRVAGALGYALRNSRYQFGTPEIDDSCSAADAALLGSKPR